MVRKKVGEVTEDEKEEVLMLYERKSAIKELFLTLSSQYLTEWEKENLKDRIIEDMTKANSLYEKWWRDKREKYNWKLRETGQWLIDFRTREIYLDIPNEYLCKDSTCEHLNEA